MRAALAALLALGGIALALLGISTRKAAGSGQSAGPGGSGPVAGSDAPEAPLRVEVTGAGSPHPADTGASTWSGLEVAQLMQVAGARWAIPWELLAGIAYAESTFDPRARGAAGEIGMFQIMPATGVALLRRELPDEPIPARRLEDVGLGAWIAGALLAELRDHLGLLQDEAFPDDWRRVLSGYNLGEPKVQGGTRNAAYEDRVVNWIKSRGSDIAALVPVEAVTV